MKLQLEDKHNVILAKYGHLLVTGGPGSGKTTIALIKAQRSCLALKPGQEILFLSFSRAAVRQIVTACKDILTRAERRLIQVKTYHSFCLETLHAHGGLLCRRPVSFLYPGDERLRRSTFNGDWRTERNRILTEEGLFCFDLFAPSVATIFEQCAALRALYADKFPLVIVDEFQDTDDDQWRIIQQFLQVTDVFCLADPEQRIFEYRKNVDPKRIEALRALANPAEFDLGGDNFRSPASGILGFADAILRNLSPLPKAKEVKVVSYYNRSFEPTVHAAVVWTFSKLREQGIEAPSVAVLCRSNPFVARLSAILSEKHMLNGQQLRPVEHDVVWDADLSAASAQVVGSLMEWPTKEPAHAVNDTLHLIAHYYRLKNAEKPSNAARENARKFEEAAQAIAEDRNPRIKAGKDLVAAVADGFVFIGDPVADWRSARRLLLDIKGLNELFHEARLVRLFRATDALAAGLSDLWLSQANYGSATDLVKRTLTRERLLSADRDPQGCMLKTIHKAKGKEYDSVVLVEGAYASKFFDQNREKPPYPASRRLLRVGITRARSHVVLVRPHGAHSLVDS